MKIINKVLTLFVLFISLPILVHAASGSVKVGGTNQAVLGNNVTVSVTLSSSVSIGSWNLSLNYDKAYLQLVSTDSEGGGNRMVNSSATGIKSKTYTFKFKTLKQGSTTVSISSYEAYAFDDFSEISLSPSNKTIKIVTQAEIEASYSKDNNLKSLGVEGFEITPAFSKDTLDYSAVVPEDTKEVKINATANDSKASVSGAGTVEVNPGTNAFEIVVKAENGSEKKYKLTVEVKDNNPIIVKVDNKEYSVVKIKEYLEAPIGFEESTITLEEIEIPAFHSDITKITLVGLKDEEGNIALYIYDNGKYTKYNELSFNKLTIYPVKTNKTIDGYKKTTIKINDVKYDAFKMNSNSRYAIIYGVNVENGEEDFYLYDSKDNTLIKYNEEYISILEKNINNYTYVIIGIISLSILIFIIFVIVICKKNKTIKRLKNKEFKDNILDNDDEIIEIKKKKK